MPNKYNEEQVAGKILRLLKDKYPNENWDADIRDASDYLYNFLCYDYTEENGKLKNGMINYLLSLHDEEIDWFFWNVMYFYDDSYFDGLAREFVDSIEKAKENYNNEWELYSSGEKQYNQTSPIDFEMGQLVPMTDEYQSALSDIIKTEKQTLEGCEAFIASLSWYNRQSRAMFAIKNKDEIAGYAGFTEMQGIGAVETKNTYNLEYYICPQYRGKHYAKTAVKAIIDAAFTKNIIVNKDGDNYGQKYKYIAVPLEVKLIKASIDPNNIASINTAKSLGFKEYGSMLYVDKANNICEHKNFVLINKSL